MIYISWNLDLIFDQVENGVCLVFVAQSEFTSSQTIQYRGVFLMMQYGLLSYFKSFLPIVDQHKGVHPQGPIVQVLISQIDGCFTTYCCFFIKVQLEVNQCTFLPQGCAVRIGLQRFFYIVLCLEVIFGIDQKIDEGDPCLLYTSPSPRDQA